MKSLKIVQTKGISMINFVIETKGNLNEYKKAAKPAEEYCDLCASSAHLAVNKLLVL